MASKPYNGFTPSQRSKAGRWVRKQREAGMRAHHTVCHACLREGGSVAGHSEDYREPFGPHIGEIGLCYPCHMAVHNRFHYPEAFTRYRNAIRNGYQWPDTQDFGQFMDWFRKLRPPLVNDPRDSTWLDTLLLDEEATYNLYPPHEQSLF